MYADYLLPSVFPETILPTYLNYFHEVITCQRSLNDSSFNKIIAYKRIEDVVKDVGAVLNLLSLLSRKYNCVKETFSTNKTSITILFQTGFIPKIGNTTLLHKHLVKMSLL